MHFPAAPHAGQTTIRHIHACSCTLYAMRLTTVFVRLLTRPKILQVRRSSQLLAGGYDVWSSFATSIAIEE